MKLLKRESPVNFKDHRVRVVDIDGNPWFVASDVCKALGLQYHRSNGYSHHLRQLHADQVTPVSETGVKLTGVGQAHARLISESGLYKLIMRSEKAEAREFQDWIASDVLPAIRKDGMYVKGEEKIDLTDDDALDRLTELVLEEGAP